MCRRWRSSDARRGGAATLKFGIARRNLDCSAGALAGCRAGTLPAHPEPFPISQSRLHGILHDILPRALEVRYVAREMVVVFPLPKGPMRPQNSICFFRCIRFLP